MRPMFYSALRNIVDRMAAYAGLLRSDSVVAEDLAVAYSRRKVASGASLTLSTAKRTSPIVGMNPVPIGRRIFPLAVLGQQ